MAGSSFPNSGFAPDPARRLLQRFTKTLDQTCQRFVQVVKQMPSIRYLHRLQRPDICAFDIVITPVAAHDLHFRVASQPGGKGFGRSLGEQVNGAMLLQVDENRAITLAATKRPIVDAYDAHL